MGVKMLLFDEKNRNYDNPKKIIEGDYEYLDKVSLEWGNQVRKILNKWFSNVPVDEKKDLKRRFQKDDFHAAFFELFLHEMFSKLGYKITIHPDIVGVNKHPDFLLEKDDFKFYLEAKLCKEKSDIEEKRDKFKHQLYDDINKLKSEKYFLLIEKIEFLDNRQPSAKIIKIFLKRELEKINIKSDDINDPNYNDKYRIKYEDDSVKISFIPILKKYPRKSQRLIGVEDIEVKYSNFIKSFRNSIRSKVDRYGDLKTPFIIAVNIFESGISNEEILDALFGTPMFLLNTASKKIEKITRKKDGIMFSKNGVQNKRVSGILTFSILPTDLYNKRLENKNMNLFHNPWTNYPFPKNIIPVNEFLTINSSYQEVKSNINLYKIMFTSLI